MVLIDYKNSEFYRSLDFDEKCDGKDEEYKNEHIIDTKIESKEDFYNVVCSTMYFGLDHIPETILQYCYTHSPDFLNHFNEDQLIFIKPYFNLFNIAKIENKTVDSNRFTITSFRISSQNVSVVVVLILPL